MFEHRVCVCVCVNVQRHATLVWLNTMPITYSRTECEMLDAMQKVAAIEHAWWRYGKIRRIMLLHYVFQAWDIATARWYDAES